MQRTTFCFWSAWVLAALLIVNAGPALRVVHAAEAAWTTAGARAGWSFNDGDASFSQFDVFGHYGLPWHWQWGHRVNVASRLTGSAGLLAGGGDLGLLGSMGFAFVFGVPGGALKIDAGSALTLMSEDEYGDEDLGGPLAFTHHVGMTWDFTDRLGVFGRIQHMSNAGLYGDNPGVNMIMFGGAYRF